MTFLSWPGHRGVISLRFLPEQLINENPKPKTKRMTPMKHSPKSSLLPIAICSLSALLVTGLAAQEDSPRKGKKGPKGKPSAALLERFDENQDGKLSQAERETARAAMKAKRDQADANSDGELSKEERLAAFRKHLESNPELSEKVLARFDDDSSGDLSDSELEKAASKMKRARGARGERARGRARTGSDDGPRTRRGPRERRSDS